MRKSYFITETLFWKRRRVMCTTCAKHNPGGKKKVAVKTAKKTKKK
ncbi:MAG: hypothetical protein AAB277_01190 [Planctomycetota bacterium]